MEIQLSPKLRAMTQQPRTPTQVTDPSGKRLAQRVRSAREARGWSTYEVSRKLKQAGRPIAPSALSKIERAERRVDVGDMVALAAVLGVSPNALLLPTVADETRVGLTPEIAVTSASAWRWATGEEPLDEEPWRSSFTEESEEDHWERARQFRRANRPHDIPVSIPQVLAHQETVRPIWDAVRAARSQGIDLDLIKTYLRMREEAEALKARRERGDDGESVD